MKTLASLLLILFCVTAYADDEKTEKKPQEKKEEQKSSDLKWIVAISASKTRVARTSSIETLRHSYSTTTTKDKPSYAFGAEVLAPQKPHLSVGGLVEWSEYQFSDERRSDKNILAMALIRAHTSFSPHFIGWVGLGLGLGYTQFGDLKTERGASAVEGTNYSSLGIVYSPRAGVDLVLGKFLAGLQVAAISTRLQQYGFIRNMNDQSVVRFNRVSSRAWIELGARLGFQF